MKAVRRHPPHPRPAPPVSAPPSYAVWGGLVFLPLNLPFLLPEFGKDYEWEAPLLPGAGHRLVRLARPASRWVILSSVLTG